MFLKVKFLSSLSFFRIERNLVAYSRLTLPRDDQLVVGVVAAGAVAAAAGGEGAAVTETE